MNMVPTSVLHKMIFKNLSIMNSERLLVQCELVKVYFPEKQ